MISIIINLFKTMEDAFAIARCIRCLRLVHTKVTFLRESHLSNFNVTTITKLELGFRIRWVNVNEPS